MNRKRVSYRRIVVVLLSIFALTLAAMLASAQPTADSFGVNDASGQSGTYVIVPVNITNATNGPILGVGFEIAYNKSVINVISVSKGNQVSNWSEPNVNNSFAWGTKITIAGFHKADAIPNGRSGPVVLLNFHVIGSPGATSPMSMTLIELSNPDGVAGTAPARNGTFTVKPAPSSGSGGGGYTPTPTPSPTPTEKPPAAAAAAATATPTETPAPAPSITPSAPITERPAPTPGWRIPGFEAVFALAVLFAVAYMVLGRRRRNT